MGGVKRGLVLVGVVLAFALGAAQGQAPTTIVQDTVYRADGQAASGSVTVNWGAFTTADGTAIPAGSTTVTLGAGGALSIALAPNAGATPMGSYYTAVFHLSDGTVSREFWVVPVTVPGGGTAKLAGIRNQVLPTSVAMQTVSKAYVDASVAKAMAGVPPSSSPFVLKAGDTLTGPLVLTADPASAYQAADKHYVDASIATAESAAVAVSRLPVFGASGAGHAAGIVPDPGASAGGTRFLREDQTWTTADGAVPGGTAGGDLSGSYPGPTVSAVHATAGTLDGVDIGTTTPGVVRASTLTTTGALASGAPAGLGALISPGLNTGVAVGTGSGNLGYLATYNDSLSFGMNRNYANGNFANPGETAAGMGIDVGNGTSDIGFFTTTVNNTNPPIRMYVCGNGDVSVGNTDCVVLFSVGASSVFQVDGSGNVSASTYAGPASAPSGTCTVNGAWVFSQDGHASFCAAGTWVVKI